jgi:hypothetical protein
MRGPPALVVLTLDALTPGAPQRHTLSPASLARAFAEDSLQPVIAG